jgi:hypothetical protein
MFATVRISFFLLVQNDFYFFGYDPYTKPLEFFEKVCQKARVFGLGSPSLKGLLLQVTKE